MANRNWAKDIETCSRATSGPWTWKYRLFKSGVKLPIKLDGKRSVLCCGEDFNNRQGRYEPYLDVGDDDMEFIAAAREGWPAALEERARLEAENRRLKAIVEPLEAQDEEMLRRKIQELKQTDGESWAIGEVIERLLAALEEAKE